MGLGEDRNMRFQKILYHRTLSMRPTPTNADALLGAGNVTGTFI